MADAYDLAAWRIRGHLKKDKGDLWTRAANYHSRTPRYNAVYRKDLRVKAAKWVDWLEARFVTVDVTKKGAMASLPVALAAVKATRAQARRHRQQSHRASWLGRPPGVPAG